MEQKIEARVVDPMKEDIRYIDGPWRNDACLGYAIFAMEREGLNYETISRTVGYMKECFDNLTVKEAAEHYIHGRFDPPQGLCVGDRLQMEKTYDLEYAKELIDYFLLREYGQEEKADYADLSDIEIAYTTTEDEKHEVQASVNLIDYQLTTKVDEKVIRTERYTNLRDFIENCLAYLDFDELVYVSDEELLHI